VTTREVTTFSDAVNPVASESYSSRDPTFDLGKNEDSLLANFLSRPIKIHESSWDVGGVIDTSFDPWTLFLQNPSVAARINNFAYLRGDLRIKVLINGNSFYYGKTLAAYQPLQHFDQVFVHSVAGTNPNMELMALSQMPSAEIDSNDSKGCELECDFLWPFNYVRLNSTTDAGRLGRVYLKSYHNLRHANGGTDALTVSMFAWLENVVLTTPTTATFQSGFFSGEYGKGAISGVATSVASVAEKLATVPVIGPYAKATSQVATTLGGVAKAFGFSRPVNLDMNTPVKRKIVSSLAVTDNDETIDKLTLDSKQELSVDPRVCGLLPVDEMSLAHVLPKESYLTQLDWSVSDPTDHLLFNAHVSPTLCNVDTSVATPVVPMIGHTPMSHASQLFEYWTGSITFRFSIVASAYHKGRLRITVDPFYKVAGVTNWNHVYSRIVDISEERDFEICVSWLQNEAFKPVHAMRGINQGYGSLQYTAVDSTSNGVISVEVLNGLTTPNDASTEISILTYVKGGDDLTYFGPKDQLRDIKSVHGDFQSGFFQSGFEASPNGIPGTQMCVGEDGQREISDHTFDVYAGEKAVSFRQLLRRYWFYRNFLVPQSGASTSWRKYIFHNPIFPGYHGYGAAAYDATDTLSGYNYVGSTLLNYLAPAYVCRRGSIRYKFLNAPNSHNAGTRTMSVVRNTDSIGDYAETRSYSGSSQDATAMLGVELDHSGEGLSITVPFAQPSLEVELPYYSNTRFSLARNTDTKGNAFDNSDVQNYTLSCSKPGYSTSEDDDIVNSYVSTGEDFMLGMYLHAPAVYVYTDPSSL
jgi:hypothetical protein